VNNTGYPKIARAKPDDHPHRRGDMAELGKRNVMLGLKRIHIVQIHMGYTKVNVCECQLLII
jgi:hypothetical protein